MENRLILLDTIQTLCHGISQQQTLIENDQLINPLLPHFDNPGNPVVPNVDNAEPITLYNGSSRKLRAAIAASIRMLMNQHHFPLPQNWTYEQLADEIIGQPVDLVHLLDIFSDLTTFGFASQPFHQLLDFLHTVAQPAAVVLGA
jgi:hypothetical protein